MPLGVSRPPLCWCASDSSALGCEASEAVLKGLRRRRHGGGSLRLAPLSVLGSAG